MGFQEESEGIWPMTIYMRITQDQRYGLKKNGEFWRIEKLHPNMIGILSDPKDFDEAVERDKMRIEALLPPPPPEEEEIF